MAMRESVGLTPVAALLVRGVEEDGPAAAAGIRTGDVLLRAGERDLRSVASLYAAMDEADGALGLSVLRGTERRAVTVAPAPGGTRDAPAATAGRSARGEHRI
jgi:serine protease Do